MEAEVLAAQERKVVPLETRMQKFKELLEEKKISAFRLEHSLEREFVIVQLQQNLQKSPQTNSATWDGTPGMHLTFSIESRISGLYFKAVLSSC